MTVVEFRIMHSELIECYQKIEFALKGICASVSGKNWFDGLDDASKENMGKLLKMIEKYEKDNGLSYIDDEGFNILHLIRSERNYWCHNCYDEMGFIDEGDIELKRIGVPIGERLVESLYKTKPIAEALFKLDSDILKQNPMPKIN